MVIMIAFGPLYFFFFFFFFVSYVPSEKFLGPEQSPPNSDNDLKDGVQLLLSNLWICA